MQYRWRLRWTMLISVFATTSAAQDLTTRDFSRRSDLVGRIISVSARIRFTMHDAHLLPDSCGGRAEGAALLFPEDRGAPPVNFEIAPGVLSSLSPFFRLTGGSATACGVLRGQLVTKKRFHLRHAGGGPMGNGFGSRGAFRYAFILQSVTDIRSCE